MRATARSERGAAARAGRAVARRSGRDAATHGPSSRPKVSSSPREGSTGPRRATVMTADPLVDYSPSVRANSPSSGGGCDTMLDRWSGSLLGSSLLVILGGAELFTNGVEWIGEGFGLSEGVVGSVLAAVGTALPETILPLVAILSGHAAGEEIGIGAILGAPFMLTTLAMFVVGDRGAVYARGGRRSTRPGRSTRASSDRTSGTSCDVRARGRSPGCVHVKALHYGLAIVLVVGYVFYVRAPPSRARGGASSRTRRATEIQPLYLWGWLRRVRTVARRLVGRPSPRLAAVRAGGHRARADRRRREDVRRRAVDTIGTSARGVASRVLAAGRAGRDRAPREVQQRAVGPPPQGHARARQHDRRDGVPVVVPGHDRAAAHARGSSRTGALAAALVALVAGGVLWLTLRFRGRLSAPLLLLQGVFYVGYVAYVITKV